jgi:flavodoxin
MKQIIITISMVLFTNLLFSNTKIEKQNRSLVLYYSITGNTEKAAKLIADETGADLIKINKDMVIFKNAFAARKTIRLESSLKTNYKEYFEDFDLSDYDNIYLGSPCWYYTYVPAIQQFLDYANYQNKKITLFLTHGGNYGKTEDDLVKSAEAASELSFIEFHFRRKTPSDEELSELVKSKLLSINK